MEIRLVFDWSGFREAGYKEGWQRHKRRLRVMEMFYIFVRGAD